MHIDPLRLLKREEWVVTKEIAAPAADKVISEHIDHPFDVFPGEVQVWPTCEEQAARQSVSEHVDHLFDLFH